MSLEIGQLIEGKYRISRLIGEGGMGAVYEGENIRINRRVAIKVLHAAFTGNAEVMQRFEREAQAAGRIGNDHILEVIDLGSLNDGDHYIVMEYLDGESLSNRIKVRGRLTPHEVTPIAKQVLAGLAAAHHAGIVHRDLKPDNIFILKEKAGVRDFVKIIDFGISKFQPLSGDGMKMTRTGAVMGTPYYMSPEQASGSHEADHRSDVYSIGVILFEAVTGRVPFDAATFNQLMFKIVLADVPTVESIVPDIDPAYSSIIAKAMARDINQRFQSAEDFIAALNDWTTRGTAVSVPPPVDAVTAGLVPHGRASMASASSFRQTASAAGPAGTAGNWATSQPDTPIVVPKKSSAGLAVAAVAGALLIAGGAFAALRMSGKGDAPQATAAQPTAPVPVVPPSPPANTAATPTPAPTQTHAAIDVAPAPSAAVSAEKPAAAAAPAARPAVVARPAARPPAPRPVKPAKPTSASGKGSSPDFGY